MSVVGPLEKKTTLGCIVNGEYLFVVTMHSFRLDNEREILSVLIS